MCDDVFEMEKHVNAIHAIYNGLDKTFDEQDDAATKIEMEIASQLSNVQPQFGHSKKNKLFSRYICKEINLLVKLSLT